jgi:hypothetical protein
MSVDGRQIATPAPVDIGNIGMADRYGVQTNLDLCLPRRAQVDFFYRQWLAEGAAYGCFDTGHVKNLPAFSGESAAEDRVVQAPEAASGMFRSDMGGVGLADWDIRFSPSAPKCRSWIE